MQLNDRFESVDNRRPRTVKVTSISEDGLSVELTNEATNRTTKVKANRLTSHGGYKPLKAPLATTGNETTNPGDSQQS